MEGIREQRGEARLVYCVDTLHRQLSRSVAQ